MSEIKDYKAYTECMKLGLYDKCWWIDKVLPQIRQIEKDFGIKWSKAVKTHAKVLWTNRE